MSSSRPFSRGGKTARFPLKTTPTRRPPAPVLLAKDDRTKRTAEQIKTMKTTQQNKQSAPGLEFRSEQHRVGNGSVKSRETLGKISFERRRANRSLMTSEVVDLLQREAPALFEMAEVVGTWIWITFRERQPASITSQLSELGFHWSRHWQAWQHPCGALNDAGRRHPREKYATYSVTDRQGE